MKNKKKICGLVIAILLIGIVVGVYVIKPMIETHEVYSWAQSLDAERIKVATIGSYSLTMEEKKELVKILKGMSRRDISLLDEDAGAYCDYALYLTTDGKRFLIGKSYITHYSAVMEYKGIDYTFDCEKLRDFMRRIYKENCSDLD